MFLERWIRVAGRRLRALFKRRASDAELHDELQFHVEQTTKANLARGMTPDEARRAALLRMGGLDRRKEECREARGIVWHLDVLAQDLRSAARSLLKTRGLTTVAILSLALGIGSSATVFSMVGAILLKPLPYPEPDRLVTIRAISKDRPGEQMEATIPEYWAWKTQAMLFDAMGTMAIGGADLGSDENGAPAERITEQFLSPSMFRVLNVHPRLGRAFREDDAPIGRSRPIVLISDGLWERRFNRDPGALNKTLRIDGEVFTVVGVMPPGFGYPAPDSADLWKPFAVFRRQLQGSARGFPVVGRLKPAVTIAQAQAEMDRISAQIAGEFPARSAGWNTRIEPLHTSLYGSMQAPLIVLGGVVGIVLLIACANVAGLLLARASSRSAELAIRAAIGAGRARIARQWLTESVLLAAAGGVAGLGVAWAGLRVLIAMGPATVPRLKDVVIDGEVLAFTAGVSLLTALVFGVAPALRASGPALSDPLKASGRVMGEGIRQQRIRSGLVVLQIALAFVLLAGSALLIRSFLELQASNLGADPRRVLTFTVTFSQARFQSGVGTDDGRPMVEMSPVPSLAYRQIWEKLQGLPGVQSAAGIQFTPFTGGLSNVPFAIEGRAPDTPEARAPMAARWAIVTPKFFETMKIPIIRGRDFLSTDTVTSPWGVVINEAMAAKYWPGENPLGRRVTLNVVRDEGPREVIGVVGNARLTPYERVPQPVMYTLHDQQSVHARGGYSWQRLMMTFLLRTDLNAESVVPTLRRALAEIDPDRPLADVRPLETIVGDQIEEPRYAGALVSIFAGVALLLAAIGLYGVIAFGVTQRTREIGIRMALGADRKAILQSIAGRTAMLVGIALVIGLAGALAASRVLTTVLWGVAPTDPATYAAVSVVIALVAVLAVAIPARRALGIAPTVALRQE